MLQEQMSSAVRDSSVSSLCDLYSGKNTFGGNPPAKAIHISIPDAFPPPTLAFLNSLIHLTACLAF